MPSNLKICQGGINCICNDTHKDCALVPGHCPTVCYSYTSCVTQPKAVHGLKSSSPGLFVGGNSFRERQDVNILIYTIFSVLPMN